MEHVARPAARSEEGRREPPRLGHGEGDVAEPHPAEPEPRPVLRIELPRHGHPRPHPLGHPVLDLVRDRRQEGLPVGEVPVRGVRRDARLTGDVTQPQGRRTAGPRRGEAGVDQGSAEITVVVGIPCARHP